MTIPVNPQLGDFPYLQWGRRSKISFASPVRCAEVRNTFELPFPVLGIWCKQGPLDLHPPWVLELQPHPNRGEERQC